MTYLKALILGLVQGLTEFIPVSSSGHLVLSMHFLDIEMPSLTFEMFVHLGSLVAVFIYFRKELLDLLKSVIHFKNPLYLQNRKMCWWLLVATIVTGVFGLLFKDAFEGLFKNPLFTACMIGVTGVILFFSDKINTKAENTAAISGKRTTELNLKKSVFIGFGQALAITPGISRSGTTITFALLSGLDRKQAASFSFLLSIPAILGANIADFKSIVSLESTMLVNYLIGFVAAFVSGYFVINGLIKLVVKAKLHYFSYYCWGVSVLCIALLCF